MFCMDCGTKLPDEAKFCFNCGAPVDSAQLGENDKKPLVMIPAVCEACGSSDFTRYGNGLLRCNHCGTSYALDLESSRRTDFTIVAGSLKKYTGEDCDVAVPYDVVEIAINAFGGLPIRSVILPEGLVSIEDGAFNGCFALESVHMPSTLLSIGNWAFNECPVLEDVNLPPNLQTIGASAFQRCPRLESIQLPPKLESMGDWAFNGCSKLKSVKVPSTIKHIGEGTFNNCFALRDVQIPPEVESIGAYAFNGCRGLGRIDLPKGTTVDPLAFT